MIKAIPIPNSPLGGVIDVRGRQDAFSNACRQQPEQLAALLNDNDGLLVIKGLSDIAEHPEQLVVLSSLFGNEVEDYTDTPTPRHMIHEAESQILVISNLLPYDRQPPEPPSPSATTSGDLPVQFPHRHGWHTDQSFRRPPPDISLFYGVTVTPHGQGQTLFANGYRAYADLPQSSKDRIENLNGLHAILGTGRSRHAVCAGEPPKPLQEHQRSQPQPLVRIHPITQRPALFLCEYGQMDWLDGPVVGLEPGPDGEGAQLIAELITHYTDPQYVYVHEWDSADLVIYDNRCLIHSATWYDAAAHDRLMWRTTVHGNPGPEYDGERKSWLPQSGQHVLEGLDEARWNYQSTKRQVAPAWPDKA